MNCGRYIDLLKNVVVSFVSHAEISQNTVPCHALGITEKLSMSRVHQGGFVMFRL